MITEITRTFPMMEQREFGQPPWNRHNLSSGHPEFTFNNWLPLTGRKRKGRADESDLDCSFQDQDCAEPPSKQFALDKSIPPSSENEKSVVMNTGSSNDGLSVIHPVGQDGPLELQDVEMEDTSFELAQSSPVDVGFNNNNSKPSFSRKRTICCEDDEYSCDHDGLGLSPAKIRKDGFGTVVFSEEIRASLAKSSDEISHILPPSLFNQKYKNATALVVWQPPAVLSKSKPDEFQTVTPTRIPEEDSDDDIS